MTRIWLGPYHGCATLKSGALECWGANDVGQLGDGTSRQSLLPVAVSRATSAPDDLALGARHTCALSAGSVTCWGDASRGQHATLSGVSAIAAGGDQTCAITKEGIRCWGDGNAAPAAPEGMVGVASLIAVGPGRVCAAMTEPSRVVRCAGADDRGQSAGQQAVLLGASMKGLAAGKQHTCALLEDGSIQCWGANDLGQLGDGTTTDTHVPVLVHALPPAVEIRAGNAHTCARLRNNTVACWGDNHAHQLANGTSEPSARPLPLVGLVGVFELALAGDSACARLAEGGARCWGSNEAGQLGDGTVAAHDVPMPIRSPLK